MNEYAHPLDQLLRLGEVGLGTGWQDYRSLGIGPEHAPDLIRMATDADLIFQADEEDVDQAADWAPQHALRAIGQLGAVEAAAPLLDGLDRLIDIHDFWVEDLGDVMAALGPGTLPAIEAYLRDDSREESCRLVVVEAFPKIAGAHPEARGRCIEVLTGQLDRHDSEVPSLNGFIISSLIDLEAIEAAPSIEAAFKIRCVDESIAGDWPNVRYDLGLGPMPEARRLVERRIAEMNRGVVPGHGRPDLKKLKQQEKRQKQSRKAKRKRKK
jgi:hypothetical protein